MLRIRKCLVLQQLRKEIPEGRIVCPCVDAVSSQGLNHFFSLVWLAKSENGAPRCSDRNLRQSYVRR